jgi:hypothetical protein
LAAFIALLPAFVAAQAATLAPAQIVALVKATPQLRIDETLFSSSSPDSAMHPYVNVRDAPEGTIGGYVVAEYAHDGKLADGTYVLAVPLDSGGSGGIFTQIVFAGAGSGSLSYVGYVDSGGHLSVQIEAGVIVSELPYYGDNSPNCCPKKYIVQTYTVRNGRLLKLSERFEPARAE